MQVRYFWQLCALLQKAIDGKYHKGNGTCSTTQWLLLLFWLFTIECFYHLGLQENQ